MPGTKELTKMVAALEEKVRTMPSQADNDWVEEEATKDTFTWVTEYTRTYNEHWQKERRPRPDEHFPQHPYLYALFYWFEKRDIIWIEKSRDMMISWACVAYLTLKAMKTPYCGILFQAQNYKKVIQLVEYAKTLWRNSDPRIKNRYPLAKPLERQAAHELRFANGSSIIGIPGGANQIRSYHPWGYLNDESSFQPDAGECYHEAIAAAAGKIIFNSSAGPGWYADARHDVIRNVEN